MECKTSHTILQLLRRAISGRTEGVEDWANTNWQALYATSRQHGITAIVWHQLQELISNGEIPAEQLPDRAVKLSWAVSAENIVKKYRKQERLSAELAEIYAKQGISTIVLKGLAISGYYPTAEHRECGDLDCFLLGRDNDSVPTPRYAEGNRIAKEAGAKVEEDFYKHSHINFRGMMVENHAFCTAIRGSRSRKEFERHLQQLLITQATTPIANSLLLRPCADFNALFLTAHSFGHYLTEGIKLRHIVDWTLLLKAEQDNIDWVNFYAWCDRMHYTKFAEVMTAIAVEYLGLEITNPVVRYHSTLTKRVIEDVMHSNRSIHNIKASKAKKRMLIIRSRLFGGWRYRDIYEKSAFMDTLSMITSFIVERNPKL